MVDNSNTMSAFDSVTQSLKFPNESEDAWWQKCGLMLARMIASADYSWDDQIQYLSFFAQVVVPRLGPYPPIFQSSVTRSGLPFELSVNYQQKGKPPVVRLGLEPLGELSGSDKDPFNRIPAAELVSALSGMQLQNFDTQLWDLAARYQTVNDEEQKSIKGAQFEAYVRSQFAFGIDVKDGKVSAKGYTFPNLKCKVTGKSMATLIEESIQKMQHLIDCSQGFSMVKTYLDGPAFDERSFFAWDMVPPAQSRLKYYTATNNVTWEKLEEVWTLGGRLSGPTVSAGLEYLKRFFNLIELQEGERKLEAAHDDREDTAKATPMLWSYEMKDGNPNPMTKVYFPLHGENDMKVITGMAQFLRDIGLVEIGNSYVENVKSY